jgi:hypothetical protein
MNVIDVRGVEWLMNAEDEKGMAADYDRRGQCQNRKSPEPQNYSRKPKFPYISFAGKLDLTTYISRTSASQVCIHGGLYLVDVHLPYIGVHLPHKRVPYGRTPHRRVP